MTKSVISRVMHKNIVLTPNADIILYLGDVVRAVGTEEALERVKLLIGYETNVEIPIDSNFDVGSILVTNKDVVKKNPANQSINRV